MPNFFDSLHPQGILSFPPDSAPIPLQGLNVLIGPNGSGKSNLLEVISLLKSVPVDLAGAIRQGGGFREWQWKGETMTHPRIGCVMPKEDLGVRLDKINYEFHLAGWLQVTESVKQANSPAMLYSSVDGPPVIYVDNGTGVLETMIPLPSLDSKRSVLAQIRDSERYYTVTWLAARLPNIEIFQDSSFGRFAAFRQPQSADLPNDNLLSDGRNIGLVLNSIEHRGDWKQLQAHIKRFLPRFERLSIKIEAGTVQVFFHESGLNTPTPAVRLSDGTLRFLALLAILLSPSPAPLICIDEPEMGLHPDAVHLLAELLLDASTRTQLIITTHSDVLISALTDQAESVLVCENNQGTKIKPLESQKLKFWLDRYRLGDLWRMGEIGGNP